MWWWWWNFCKTATRKWVSFERAARWFLKSAHTWVILARASVSSSLDSLVNGFSFMLQLYRQFPIGSFLLISYICTYIRTTQYNHQQQAGKPTKRGKKYETRRGELIPLDGCRWWSHLGATFTKHSQSFDILKHKRKKERKKMPSSTLHRAMLMLLTARALDMLSLFPPRP